LREIKRLKAQSGKVGSGLPKDCAKSKGLKRNPAKWEAGIAQNEKA
jgi:hypothetical protein